MAWKFLSGIRNRDIRAAVIKEKWMAGQDAKPLDEILLIAESTRKTMVATSATGSERGTIGAVLRRNSDEYSSSTRSSSSRKSSGESSLSPRSGRSTPSSKPNASPRTATYNECLYCKKKHPGGRKNCFVRLRNNPNWTPGKRKNQAQGKVRAVRGSEDVENFW